MSENKKEILANIFFLGLVIFVFSCGMFFGYAEGHTKGYSDGMESSKRIECEVEYFGTRFEMIPGHCIKYFQPGNVDKDGFAH